ncbi:MAG TPA: condensation domain-containing protein, partial [Pyrinomonadaceae bacterium]|nr:condensation domain-containing protein [Pyrinomonadaceae bacterium]
ILDAAALSVEDRELFALLLEEEGVAFGEQEGIGPREDAARRPLSFAQERLWFLDHLEPGSPVYNISFAVRLAGDLNVAVLERALGEVVRRHEVLRASFPTVGGQAAQVVAPAGAFRLRFAELDAEDDAEESLRQLATEEARRPFDLATGPLVRVTLVRLGEREHAALFTVHHIVSDGWSSEILIGEVAALYEAYAQGRPSPLEELPIQYADFAAWQRDHLQGETLAEQLSYWKRQLAGSPAVLELPTDRPRPAAQSFRGASRSFEVSAETSEALRALARQEGATLFMTLLAAFKVLLHRYTNQTDIVVGTPVAGRRHVETEPLVGLFVNSLVLRSDLADRPTFRQLLARVRETTLGAEAHQDVPFERLVDELQPERDFSHTPLFQVVFNHQNAPREATPMPGLTLSLLEVDGGTSKFDLQLTTEEAGRALKGALVYNTDLFDAATAERMTRHFVALLEAAALAPDASVSELPFLTGDERAQLLEGFGGARQDFRRAECVHELFERQAAETPENVAVTSGDGHLTYAELNAGAN